VVKNKSFNSVPHLNLVATSPSPHGSGTSGSRRTIAYFLDIGGRDEVDAKVV
jgi:hypothetical protein